MEKVFTQAVHKETIDKAINSNNQVHDEMKQQMPD